MTVQDIARLANTAQAVNLVGYNIGKVSKKKIDTKNILELGVGNIVGVEMIKTVGGSIGAL